MKFRLALLLLVLALASCANDQFARFRDFKSETQGYAMSGIGLERRSVCTSSELLFRLRGTEDLGSFSFSPKAWGEPPADFESKEFFGRVAVLALPPGDYDAYAVYCVQQLGTGWTRYQLPLTPSVSFRVETNQTVYLGRFIVGTGRSTMPSRATLSVTDELDAEAGIVKQRAPSAPLGSVVKALPPLSQRSL